jgi:hypothetical protein
MSNEELLCAIELKFTGDAEERFTKALRKQMELHGGVTFMDLLKFLYQSTLGPFHLFEMMNETELKSWIRKNIKKAKVCDGLLAEGLYGKKWMRINFGPYKKRFGNDYKRIYKALVKVKCMKQGQLKEYTDLLWRLVDALRKGKIKPVTEEPRFLSLVENFLEEYEEKDYPPIHHSKIYMLRNSSEYLVVPYSILDKIA